MRKEYILSLILLLVICKSISAQEIAKLTLHNVNSRIDIPVNVDLDALTYVADSSLVLSHLVGNKKVRCSVSNRTWISSLSLVDSEKQRR